MSDKRIEFLSRIYREVQNEYDNAVSYDYKLSLSNLLFELEVSITFLNEYNKRKENENN